MVLQAWLAAGPLGRRVGPRFGGVLGPLLAPSSRCRANGPSPASAAGGGSLVGACLRRAPLLRAVAGGRGGGPWARSSPGWPSRRRRAAPAGDLKGGKQPPQCREEIALRRQRAQPPPSRSPAPAAPASCACSSARSSGGSGGGRRRRGPAADAASVAPARPGPRARPRPRLLGPGGLLGGLFELSM